MSRDGKELPMSFRRNKAPREVPDDLAAKFEARAEAVGNGQAASLETSSVAEPVSVASAAVPAPSGRGNKYTRKKDGVKIRPLNAHIPVELHQKLRVYCATHDLSLSEVVVRALEKELGQ